MPRSVPWAFFPYCIRAETNWEAQNPKPKNRHLKAEPETENPTNRQFRNRRKQELIAQGLSTQRRFFSNFFRDVFFGFARDIN
jgi:hypothetical protein